MNGSSCTRIELESKLVIEWKQLCNYLYENHHHVKAGTSTQVSRLSGATGINWLVVIRASMIDDAPEGQLASWYKLCRLNNFGTLTVVPGSNGYKNGGEFLVITC